MKQEPTMECPYCKEIEFEHIDTLVGQGKRTLEYKCNDCQQIAYFDEKDKP
jgi:transposase-like protein